MYWIDVQKKKNFLFLMENKNWDKKIFKAF